MGGGRSQVGLKRPTSDYEDPYEYDHKRMSFSQDCHPYTVGTDCYGENELSLYTDQSDGPRRTVQGTHQYGHEPHNFNRHHSNNPFQDERLLQRGSEYDQYLCEQRHGSNYSMTQNPYHIAREDSHLNPFNGHSAAQQTSYVDHYGSRTIPGAYGTETARSTLYEPPFVFYPSEVRRSQENSSYVQYPHGEDSFGRDSFSSVTQPYFPTEASYSSRGSSFEQSTPFDRSR